MFSSSIFPLTLSGYKLSKEGSVPGILWLADPVQPWPGPPDHAAVCLGFPLSQRGNQPQAQDGTTLHAACWWVDGDREPWVISLSWFHHGSFLSPYNHSMCVPHIVAYFVMWASISFFFGGGWWIVPPLQCVKIPPYKIEKKNYVQKIKSNLNLKRKRNKREQFKKKNKKRKSAVRSF